MCLCVDFNLHASWYLINIPNLKYTVQRCLVRILKVPFRSPLQSTMSSSSLSPSVVKGFFISINGVRNNFSMAIWITFNICELTSKGETSPPVHRSVPLGSLHPHSVMPQPRGPVWSRVQSLTRGFSVCFWLNGWLADPLALLCLSLVKLPWKGPGRGTKGGSQYKHIIWHCVCVLTDVCVSRRVWSEICFPCNVPLSSKCVGNET